MQIFRCGKIISNYYFWRILCTIYHVSNRLYPRTFSALKILAKKDAISIDNFWCALEVYIWNLQ